MSISEEDFDRYKEDIWSVGAADRAKAGHNAPILARISELDKFIPRGLEDLIAALAVDVSTLPQIQQDRLAEKNTLRSQLLK